MNNWKKDLINLPVQTGDKIDFLLVMNNLKKGSEFQISSDLSNEDRDKINDFLKNTGMEFVSKTRNVFVNDKNIKICLVFYSKQKEILKKLSNCYVGEQWQLDEKKHIILGDIYGFPKQAVEVFAKTMNTKYLEKDFIQSAELLTFKEMEEKYGANDWFIYLTYRVRKNHPNDCDMAKKWARCVKKECLELDKLLREKGRRYIN
jgi:hypothetical protein